MTDGPSTVPAFLVRTQREVPDRVVQVDEAGEVRRSELMRDAAALAAGLRALGVGEGDRVGYIADNSRRWVVGDLALQLLRATTVPRGTDTPADELVEILRHAEVGLVFAHDARRARAIEALRDRIPTMGEVVSIAPEDAPGRTFNDLLAAGRDGPGFAELAAGVEGTDVATIIYTSGTTGRPKGVVLTQSNFAHQLRVIPQLFDMRPTEVFLSILPPWHIFERTVEYAALTVGACIAYTSLRRIKADLTRIRPTFLASVPRLWETVYDGIVEKVDKGGPVARALFRGAYAVARAHAWGKDRARGHVLLVERPRGPGLVREAAARTAGAVVAGSTWPLHAIGDSLVLSKIRRATGGRLRGAVSGGGLMPPHIDAFFRTVGVPIYVGYGLTETSPVLTLRREERNILGTIGTRLPEVEIEIRDVETGRPLPAGRAGLVFTRGPQVMRGYHLDPGLTREVLDGDGWFNTGDLGFLTEAGDLCFHGRAKETIVLSGGENVEPSHVEAVLLASPLLSQAIVVGQDRKTLAALLLPEPEPVARALGLPDVPDPAALAGRDDVRELLRQEAIRRTTPLLPFERVTRVQMLPRPLDVESGLLTQTLKLRRHVIMDRYADLVEAAYTT
jgi:long-chain acyl-CoA synthetase